MSNSAGSESIEILREAATIAPLAIGSALTGWGLLRLKTRLYA